jgi:cell division protein FtsQ
VGKPDNQSVRTPTRFPQTVSVRRSVLAEDDGPEGSDVTFYRPPARKPDRPLPGDFPFREKRSSAVDDEDDEPFLRSERRVAVRRGLIPRGRWSRIGLAFAAIAIVALLGAGMVAARSFAAHDPRFRIGSSDNIQILGNSEVTQDELLSVFGGDMGRNVFFIPLKDRRAELGRLPWVDTATVMRLLPDQLRVSIVERTPIAFTMNGGQVGLADKDGVLLPMNAKTLAAKHYSFPVVTGIEAADPASTRQARMRIFERFLADLDSTGEKFSAQFSEIDLSDPEDVRALVPSNGGDLLLHFGDQSFLNRWRIYQAHLAEWKQQYPQLASVDLRYERQVVLGMQKGAQIAPSQTPSVQTRDAEKQAVGAISPTAQRQMAASKKSPAKKSAPAHAGSHSLRNWSGV